MRFNSCFSNLEQNLMFAHCYMIKKTNLFFSTPLDELAELELSFYQSQAK